MRKKITLVVLAAALTFSLAACGNAKTDTTEATEATTAAASSETEMANPWTDVDTVDKAAEGAEVGYFTIPENGTETSGGPVNISDFRYMTHLAEAQGSIGSAELIIRKGLKQESSDVSGDMREFTLEWTQTVGDFEFKCYGNSEGSAQKLVWVSDNFSYSVSIYGQGDEAGTYGIDSDAVNTIGLIIQ